MKSFFTAPVLILSALASLAPAAYWLTDGGDIRRNNWQKDEKILTKANVKGLQLLWKTKLDNQPRQMHSLLEPLVIGQVMTKSGPRQMVIEAGVSDNVYALDATTGQLIWKRHFESTFQDPPDGRGRDNPRPASSADRGPGSPASRRAFASGRSACRRAGRRQLWMGWACPSDMARPGLGNKTTSPPVRRASSASHKGFARSWRMSRGAA